MGFPLISIHIEGMQAAQSRNQRRIAMMQPSGLPGKVAQFVAIALQAYAIDITPVDTGAWKNSHRILDKFGIGRAEVYVSPFTTNPRSGGRVIEYAQKWEDQGGDYAVYQRTIRERGGQTMRAALQMAKQAIQNA